MHQRVAHRLNRRQLDPRPSAHIRGATRVYPAHHALE